jgi:hypothetical protein
MRGVKPAKLSRAVQANDLVFDRSRPIKATAAPVRTAKLASGGRGEMRFGTD